MPTPYPPARQSGLAVSFEAIEAALGAAFWIDGRRVLKLFTPPGLSWRPTIRSPMPAGVITAQDAKEERVLILLGARRDCADINPVWPRATL